MAKKEIKRCSWPGDDDKLYIAYHDNEWGVPLHDDRKLFEFMILEIFQAGLSWRTVLYKRENFRKGFAKFDYNKVAKFGAADIKRLMNDAGIIRNRAKIEAAINNAQRYLEVRKEFGTFDKYIWSFVGGKPIQNRLASMKHLPATSKESDALSKDLKQRGFKFVGSTIVYAHMQAVGMVNDHLVTCFRQKHCARLK